jgi:hypothetical protein
MSGMTPQNAAIHRQQALNQHHPQNFNQQLGNAHAMSPELAAHLRAQSHALNQQRAMQQQRQQQQEGQQQYQQQSNAQNAFQQPTANYSAQVRKLTQEIQHFQAQAAAAGSPQQSQTPHQQAAQMNHHTSQPGMQPQGQGQLQQPRPGQPFNSQQVQQLFVQRVRLVFNHLFQQIANQHYGGNHQLIDQAQRDALQLRAKTQVMQEMTQRGIIPPQQRQGQITQQQIFQMQQQQAQQQGTAQGQGNGGGMQNGPQNMAFIRQQQALQQQQQQQGMPGAGGMPK